jgi:hypothetical protein
MKPKSTRSANARSTTETNPKTITELMRTRASEKSRLQTEQILESQEQEQSSDIDGTDADEVSLIQNSDKRAKLMYCFYLRKLMLVLILIEAALARLNVMVVESIVLRCQ